MVSRGSAGRNYAREYAARQAKAKAGGYEGGYSQQRRTRQQLAQFPDYLPGMQGVTPAQVDNDWMQANPAPTRFGDTPTGVWPYVRMAEYHQRARVVRCEYRDGKIGYYDNVPFDVWRAYLRSRSSYLFIGGGAGNVGFFGGWSREVPESLMSIEAEEPEQG
jgi:hypothetical protein